MVLALLIAVTAMVAARARGDRRGGRAPGTGLRRHHDQGGGHRRAGPVADVRPAREARFKRFNDTNEIKGVKIKYAEFADDKQDPATALNEARRLVTQDQVFAIVGDVSQFNPVEYFTQQHVPYFGWAFDNTYCSTKPTTTL